MGNYCHQEETPKSEKPTLRKSTKGKNVIQNLILTNTQFLEQCQDLYFQQFHKNIVEKDIQSLSKFMNQKMLDSSIKGSYPTEEEKQVISKNISKDIAKKEKHIYNQLIFHYSQFLNELFELDQNLSSKPISTYKAGDIRVNAQLNRNTQIRRSLSDNYKFQEKLLLSDQSISQSKNIDQNIIRQFQGNKQLANIFLDQLSCFFKLCYLIIEYVYSNYIVSIFGTSIDSFTDRYLLISKIYQKNIIEANPLIQKLITTAIQMKYENQQSLMKSEHMSPAILQSQFIPEYVDSILSVEFEIELLDSIEQNLKYQQSDQKNQNFYYYQTFSTIDRIVNCKMPWLKFNLIGKLDLQIVDIFLQARSQSQIAHFINLIKPEDSKVEVLLYILQRYMAARKNLNLSQCYYELRWMQDDDNVLHKKVKTITCPYFSRFLSLYEIAFKNYQRKQAQLLYN